MATTRLVELQDMIGRIGWYVLTHSPGDGVTRYRFFDTETLTYFSGDGVYTALGYKEAHVFANGLMQSFDQHVW